LVVGVRVFVRIERGRRRQAELRAVGETERRHPAPLGEGGRRQGGRRRLPVARFGAGHIGNDCVPAVAGPEQQHGGGGVFADLNAGVFRRPVGDRRQRRGPQGV